MNNEGHIRCLDCNGLGYDCYEEWDSKFNPRLEQWEAEKPQWVEVQCRRCEGSGWLDVLEVLANEA